MKVRQPGHCFYSRSFRFVTAIFNSRAFLVLFSAMLFLLGNACVEPRARRYQSILEPMVGVAKRAEVDRLLGSPTFCRAQGDRQLCEYRTSVAHNRPIPDMSMKMEGFGPDVSPYDQFDVLHLYYDGFDTLKEWEPYVIVE